MTRRITLPEWKAILTFRLKINKIVEKMEDTTYNRPVVSNF